MEFVKVELRHDNHKVGINFWHMNWQTKYRYNMFAKFKYQHLCEASIRKAAKRHNIQIHVLRVMPDHLHTLVTLPKGMSDEKAMQLLKEGQNKESILDKTGMTVGVNNASFSIENGEIFVIMGLSGSGKSTIVRMLNRLIEPTAGKVIVDGEDVIQMSQDDLVNFRLKNMSMVVQSFALMPH